MIYRALMTIVLLASGGCAAPRPVITEYNGASIKISVPKAFAGTSPRPQDYAEAQRICSTTQKRAEYASTFENKKYFVDYLFLCL